MANDILQKSVTPVVFTWGTSDVNLESLANGDACCSAPVTDASPSIRRYIIAADILVNTSSAPTDNNLIKFYLARIIDGRADGNVSASVSAEYTSDADVEYIERSCQLVHALSVADTANITYTTSFIVEDPGIAWTLIVVNNTGQALAASGHEINHVATNPEIQ